MIGIVADDISGAAEVGGVCQRFGLETFVVREIDRLQCSADVIVIDTNSRSLGPTEAGKKLSRAASWLRELRPEWIYKKVDSVLRGNVYDEVVALGDSLGFERALLLPANPSLGREIRNGVYYVGNRPIDETDFANDPEHPARCSDVFGLLGRITTWPVAACRQESSIPEEGILVGDVRNEEDLSRWAWLAAEEAILPVGGSEFLVALLKSRNLEAQACSWKFKREERNMWISGSASSPCRKRILEAAERGLPVIPMPASLMVTDEDERRELRTWADTVLASLSVSPHAIVTIGQPISARPDLPARLGRYLGHLAGIMMENTPIDHLWMEGGATASAVLAELGWKEFKVAQEIRLGVVSMRPFNRSRPTVTIKPGSYDWPEGIWKPRPSKSESS